MIPPFSVGDDDRYDVTQQIAEGGTARIFVCWDKVDRAWRALKALRPDARARTDTRKRLKAEYDTLRRLNHPHVLRVFDAAFWGQDAWMVMEYAERASIGQWVDAHGPMPPGAALEVCRQLCLALEYAHGEGVIHRDIKPHNILVDARGNCVLADFGIAALDDELVTRITTTGTALGTLGYMAPEQLSSAKNVDGRADVYSVSATLFALLFGREPQDLFFTGPTDPDVIALPAKLQMLILEGTRRTPDHRIPSAASLRRWIEEAQADHPLPPGFPLLAPPAPPPLPPGFSGATIAPSGPATWEGRSEQLPRRTSVPPFELGRDADPAPSADITFDEPDDEAITADIPGDASSDQPAGDKA